MMAFIPYMDGAEPYFHAGGPVGCLVLHGFAATPDEVRWLGQHLAARGHTVFAPRLPGHGMTPAALRRIRWEDWYAAALDGYRLLASICARVCVVGHSMGGLLSLLLAGDCDVACAAALAAPIELHAARRARWLRFVLAYTDHSDRSGFPARLREEQARRGEPVRGRVRYDRWATQGVAELYALSQVAHARLPLVKAPLLLVYSRNDHVVPAGQMSIVADRVASQIVERHELHKSGHILPQDCEHEKVFQLVDDFIARYG
nr:MAG: hypothetical protein DIU68_12740 [Chloroflexota bacterium]